MRSREQAQRSIQEAAAALKGDRESGLSVLLERVAAKRAAAKAAWKAGPTKRCESDTQTSDSEESTASVLGSSDSEEEQEDGMCM